MKRFKFKFSLPSVGLNRTFVEAALFTLAIVVAIYWGLSSDVSSIQIGVIVVVLIAIFAVGSSYQLCREDHRFVIIRWDQRIVPVARGPGLVPVYRFLGERYYRFPILTRKSDLEPFVSLTEDTIKITLDAVCWYEVDKDTPTDPPKAWLRRNLLEQRVHTVVQDQFHGAIGKNPLRKVLREKSRINKEVMDAANAEISEEFGVKITSVEYQNIDYPLDMEGAMTQQAVAEAQAEAVKPLLAVAEFMEQHPMFVELLKLNTAKEMAANAHAVIVVPSTALDSLGGAGVASLANLLPRSPDGTRNDNNKPKEITTPFTLPPSST